MPDSIGEARIYGFRELTPDEQVIFNHAGPEGLLKVVMSAFNCSLATAKVYNKSYKDKWFVEVNERYRVHYCNKMASVIANSPPGVKRDIFFYDEKFANILVQSALHKLNKRVDGSYVAKIV